MFFLIGIVFVLIDQITKYLVYSKGLGNFLNYFRPIFGKEIFPNYNFAFSLQVPHFLMYAIYVVLLFWLVVWFLRLETKNFRAKLALTLILSGALSNILDRFLVGFARDFIFVFWGNVFNVADIYVLVGIALLLV